MEIPFYILVNFNHRIGYVKYADFKIKTLHLQIETGIVLIIIQYLIGISMPLLISISLF